MTLQLSSAAFPMVGMSAMYALLGSPTPVACGTWPADSGWSDCGGVRGAPEPAQCLCDALVPESTRMHAYQDALTVWGNSSSERIALAIALLERREAVVLLENRVALRPELDGVTCEVIDPSRGEHPSDQRYSALIDDAQRLLRSSALWKSLKEMRLDWCVVADYGMGAVNLWPRD